MKYRASLPSALVAASVAVAAVDPQQLESVANLQPAALALLSFCAAVMSVNKHGLPPVSRSLQWLTAWLGWAVIGAAFSSEPGTSLLSVASFAALGVAGAHLASRSSASDMAQVFGLAGIISVGLALAVAIAGGDGGVSGRLRLLFLEPNQMARAAAIVLVSVAVLWVRRITTSRDVAEIAVLSVAGGATGIVLLFTQSRTGVAAAAVGLLVVVTSQLSRRLSIVALAAVGLLLAAGAVAVLSGSAGESINSSLSRSASAPTNELRTLNGRTVLWPEVVSLAMERPVTGSGLGLDRDLISSFQAEGKVGWAPEHAHSLPLQLWLTTGIPGVLLIGAAITTAALNAWRREIATERTLVLGLLAVILVDGIVEPVLRVPSYAWLALVTAACLPEVQALRSTAKGPS